MSVDLLLDATFELAEGPRWDGVGGRLLWVDIERGELHAYDGSHDCIQLGTRVGAIAPTEDGDVLLALQDRLALLHGGTLMPCPWPADVRANDGACDPDGRFWIGSMPLDERRPVAALYRFDGLRLVPQLDGLTISNGLAWGGDRMYFIDTPTHRVDVFDYDGEISARRPSRTSSAAARTASASTTRASSGSRCTAAARCSGLRRTARSTARSSSTTRRRPRAASTKARS